MGSVKNNAEFDKRIQELKRLYKMNPGGTTKMLDEAMKSTDLYHMTPEDMEVPRYETNTAGNVIKEIGGTKIAYIVIIAILVFSGLLNFGESTPMHVFGIIFFLAGFFVGKSVPGFGLIFLFSHGGSGIGVMIGSVFATDFYQGLMTDLASPILTYFGLGAALIVVGFLMMVFYNLSPTLRRNPNIPVIALGLCTAAVVMANLLPHIYTDVLRILG